MIEKNLAWAIRKMGKNPLNPIGECFDSSSAHFLEWTKQGVVGLKLVHGLGIANLKGQEGLRMAHGWIEFVSDDEVYAYDTTWGVKMLAFEYRRILKIDYVVEYNLQDLMRLHRTTNEPPPWDSYIKEIAQRKK